MTHRTSPSVERRRHVRIEPKGSVTLIVGDHAQQGRLVNLGHGGLFAATTVGVPQRLLSRTVQIELRLDGRLAQWQRVSGRVTRIGPPGIAIAFDTTPAALVRVIDEMSTASHARFRVMSVVLVDSELRRRSILAAAFRSVGCAVIESSTPLEAIFRLGESSFEPDLIAIADSIPGTVADELRDFIDRDHPDVKLVTIGDDLVEPSGVELWLSSADPAADLAARVRELLARPRQPTRP